jgi:hypothetical protein
MFRYRSGERCTERQTDVARVILIINNFSYSPMQWFECMTAKPLGFLKVLADLVAFDAS